ncbi:DUF4232 domain-containing protein [Actinoallomurus rhizosphaericola]|uniref:DUF4232 domain-containing protein n=1 Tax=Actinoallomurus rhizosphaericola TaxID=2952536 RepID=UPI002092343C|nr:DUF4232 domain-containing protein [Actinoallomurus rhizosphaericola]MCO5997167.1 DUF4232 domain-containing protein [Actinoallomurus rhizosphaericola]
MKLSTTLAMTGVAGAIAVAGLASPAQAATTTAKAPACSVAKNKLVLQFAHGYVVGKKVDQPLSISTKSKKTCLLSGRPVVRLLNKKHKVIGVYEGAKGQALVGAGREAVFHLTFTTGGKHPFHPAYVRVTVSPKAGTFKTIRWTSNTPSSKKIKVGALKPWLD